MPAPRIMMPAPRLRFSALRRILLELGFKEIPVTKPRVGFRHEGADLPLVFPAYRGNSFVAPHHFAYVRVMLDGFGILDEDDFDRLATANAARRPATNRAGEPRPADRIRRRVPEASECRGGFAGQPIK